MIFTLMTVTPYRLRYLCTTESQEIGPDVGIIPNADLGTPDLRSDTEVWLGYPIQKLVSTGVADSAAAGALLQGVFLTSVPQIEVPRANIYLHERNSTASIVANWSAQAAEGASVGALTSAGFAVVVVRGPGSGSQECYLTIDYEHTYDR